MASEYASSGYTFSDYIESDASVPVLPSRPIAVREGEDLLALLQRSSGMHDVQLRMSPPTATSASSAPSSIPAPVPARGPLRMDPIDLLAPDPTLGSRRVDPLELLTSAGASQTSLAALEPMRDTRAASIPPDTLPPPNSMSVDPNELSARLSRVLEESIAPSHLGSRSTVAHALTTTTTQNLMTHNEDLYERLRPIPATTDDCIRALRDYLCRRLYIDYDPRFKKQSRIFTPFHALETYARFLEDGWTDEMVVPNVQRLYHDKRDGWLDLTERLAVRAGICPRYARSQVMRLTVAGSVYRSVNGLEIVERTGPFTSRPWELARAGRWKECVDRILTDLEHVDSVDTAECYGSVAAFEAIREHRRASIVEFRDMFFARCEWREWFVLGRRARMMDEKRRLRGVMRRVLGKEEEVGKAEELGRTVHGTGTEEGPVRVMKVLEGKAEISEYSEEPIWRHLVKRFLTYPVAAMMYVSLSFPFPFLGDNGGR